MALSSGGCSFVTSFPANTTLPPVGSTSLSMARPTVVLPQPLSPTSPRVSPLLTDRLTPSTAWTCPTTFPNTPFFTGKSLWRSSTTIRGPEGSGGRVSGPARTLTP